MYSIRNMRHLVVFAILGVVAFVKFVKTIFGKDDEQ